MDAEDRFCQNCGFNLVRTSAPVPPPAADDSDKTIMMPSRKPAEPGARAGAATGGGSYGGAPPRSATHSASGGYSSGPSAAPQAGLAGLLARVKAILFQPSSEWPVIAAEDTSPTSLYTSYVLPLAAIGPVAQFIGMVLIGVSVPFVGTMRIGALSGLGMAVTSYVLGLVAVYVMALIANALAPSFKGQQSLPQALKLVAYAYTPAWLAGILGVLPFLGILALVASLYALYLLYLGLPVMMKCPRDKALGYTAVLVVLGIVAGIVISLATHLFMPTPSIGDGAKLEPSSPAGAVLGELAGKDGGKRVEEMTRKMEEASKRMEAAQKSGDSAAAAAAAGETLGALFSGGQKVDPADFRELKALLPDDVDGMKRGEAQGEKTGMGGLNLATAQARYSGGADASLQLKITDMGGAGLAMTGLAAWAMVEMDKETEDGHEKTGKIDGRPFHEKYSDKHRSGEFDLVVAQRFLVEAKGHNVDLNTLKSAVSAVNLSKLESMKDVGRQH
jgi:hypothetical protein